MLATDPSAARFVLGQVAERLRTAGNGGIAPAPPERVSVVAVVGLGAGETPAEVAQVGDLLGRRLGSHLRLATPGIITPDGLTRAERGHDRVLLVAASGADGPDATWRELACGRRMPWCSWRAVAPPCPSADRHPPRRAGRILALLGEAPSPAERVAWVSVTDAWQLTLVEGDVAAGVRARRGPARRPGARAGAGRRRRPRVRPRRCAARARGRRAVRRPGRRFERRRDHRGRACHGRRRRHPRGDLLLGVRASPAVQRLPPVGPLAGPWAPGPWGDGTALRCRHRARGAAPPAVRRERRPGEPHPAGAPSGPPRRRRPGVGAPPGALRPDRHRRRPPPRRRRGARQHAHRPARRARRRACRGRDHRVRGRGPARAGRPRVPGWATP